jgi:hypothetical protein
VVCEIWLTASTKDLPSSSQQHAKNLLLRFKAHMCLSIVIVAEFSSFETSTFNTFSIINKDDFTFASQLEQVIPVT